MEILNKEELHRQIKEGKGVSGSVRNSVSV